MSEPRSLQVHVIAKGASSVTLSASPDRNFVRDGGAVVRITNVGDPEWLIGLEVGTVVDLVFNERDGA